MKTKPSKKPAVKADQPKSELKGNAAALGSPAQQAWKKKHGFCLVKGCRNKADKGHFCSQHAAVRTRLKKKGEQVEEPVDFKAAKPKAVAKKVATKKAVAPKAVVKKAAKPKTVVKPKTKKAAAPKPKAVEPTTAPVPSEIPSPVADVAVDVGATPTSAEEML